MVPRDKLRGFLDTNVIFSGIYSNRGAPGVILKYFIKGEIRAVISPQVLDEVIVTLIKKFPGGIPYLKALLLNTPPEITSYPGQDQINYWKKELSVGDSAVLAAAIQASPDYFVTGDKHFLKNPGLAKEAGLKVITPTELKKIIENRTK
jgi:putative PIN family toxin of toxin-antitoxin system